MIRSYVLWIALANLVWEAAQLPLYTIWTERSLAYNAFAVVHCTGGDVLIALATLLLAVVVVGTSEWMPVMPGLGTGLAPLGQWLVLPPLGLWLCRRRVARR